MDPKIHCNLTFLLENFRKYNELKGIGRIGGGGE